MHPGKDNVNVRILAVAFGVAVITASLASTLGLEKSPYNTADEVRAVARIIERAVLERDKELFTSTIDPKDETFLQEHKHWFDFLERFPARSFTLQMSNLSIFGSKAVANLTMAWSLEGRPENRTVTYEAAFIERGGRWFFAGPNFDVLIGRRFTMHYYPQHRDLAREVLKRLDSVLKHVSDELDYRPVARIHIKLYPDEDLLKSSISLARRRSTTGWVEPGEAIKIVVRRSGGPDAMRAILAHELTHSLLYEMIGGHGGVPWWLDEGSAQYAAVAFQPPELTRLKEKEFKRMVSQNMLLSWGELADERGLPQETYRIGYEQGLSFISYVTSRFGKDARNSWLRTVGAGDIESATLQVFGLTFQQLDQEWRSFMASYKYILADLSQPPFRYHAR